jgi:outer membrane translocation and assembly module TamA
MARARVWPFNDLQTERERKRFVNTRFKLRKLAMRIDMTIKDEFNHEHTFFTETLTTNYDDDDDGSIPLQGRKPIAEVCSKV